MADQWRTMNEHMAARRAEETDDMTFQERAHARLAALQEGFWREIKPEAFREPHDKGKE